LALSRHSLSARLTGIAGLRMISPRDPGCAPACVLLFVHDLFFLLSKDLLSIDCMVPIRRTRSIHAIYCGSQAAHLAAIAACVQSHPVSKIAAAGFTNEKG